MIAFLLAATVYAMPNPAVTPGALAVDKDMRPLTQAKVCATKWGQDERKVTPAMKRAVALSYGVLWPNYGQFVFDHLISRELGGADLVANLFPQPVAESRVKDRLENKLHKLVCGNQLSLKDAQRAIRTDWRDAYRTYVAALP